MVRILIRCRVSLSCTTSNAASSYQTGLQDQSIYPYILTLFLILQYLIEANFSCIANPRKQHSKIKRGSQDGFEHSQCWPKKTRPTKRFDNLDIQVSSSRKAWDTLRLALGYQSEEVMWKETEEVTRLDTKARGSFEASWGFWEGSRIHWGQRCWGVG